MDISVPLVVLLLPLSSKSDILEIDSMVAELMRPQPARGAAVLLA